MATYAIGDIQGCYDDLLRLLEKLNFDSTSDKVWFCGDIINRGPKSLETIRFIKSLGDSAITVLGNHDLHFLAVNYITNKPSRYDTFSDILHAEDRNQLAHWLRHQKIFHHDPALNTSMVHAGIPIQWSISDACNYASEMEVVLQSEDPHDFFHHMYGNQPREWHESLTDWDRYRFITNVFTRMRFCDQQGRPDFKFKGDIGTQPDHLTAWFSHPDRKTINDDIIFGHWSTLSNVQQPHIYPIDTGCLWSGTLTALKINTDYKERIEIDCPNGIKPD